MPEQATQTKALSTGIYTLSPTHCGTGQARGAVDLPIAREEHTRLPILPASSVKGVARMAFELVMRGDDKQLAQLFGPKLEDEAKLHAGALVFTEGRLLAFPVRSLERPFVYATSPLLLERHDRDRRSLGLESIAEGLAEQLGSFEGGALVSADELAGRTLVLEDLVYTAAEVRSGGLATLAAGAFAKLLPKTEQRARARLVDSLVVISDAELQDLVERTVPVIARVKLTEGKTTSDFIREDGTTDGSGNLWYEEALPADCLFAVLVTVREGLRLRGQSSNGKEPDPLRVLRENVRFLARVQIGGNETVGQGAAWWSLET